MIPASIHPARRVLAPLEGGEIVLSYYPAGHQMASHSHEQDQRSIILSGALAEDTPADSITAGAFQLGCKAAGLRHENRYGPQGALILAINTAPAALTETGWRRGPPATEIASLVRALLDQEDQADDAATDLLAWMQTTPAERKRGCPAWLTQVRSALHDDPDDADVQQLAAEAGVHRVSLSRAYVQHFGVSISVDRRRIKLARAVRAQLEHGAPLADAALMAGFTDQAHYTNVLRQQTGLTPHRLTRLLS